MTRQNEVAKHPTHAAHDLATEIRALHDDCDAESEAFIDFIADHRCTVMAGERQEAFEVEKTMSLLVDFLNADSDPRQPAGGWTVGELIGLAYNCGLGNKLPAMAMVRGCSLDVSSLEQPARTAKAQREQFLSFGLGWCTQKSAQDDPLHNRTLCCICDQLIDRTDVDGGKVVVEHCHQTGLVRGLAHSRCNGKEGKRNKLESPFFESYNPYYIRFSALEVAWSYCKSSELPRCAAPFNELVTEFLKPDSFEGADARARWAFSFQTGRVVENLIYHSNRLRRRVLAHGEPECSACLQQLNANAAHLCKIRRGVEGFNDGRLTANGDYDDLRAFPPHHKRCRWCP